jgi:hypothetical protein
MSAVGLGRLIGFGVAGVAVLYGVLDRALNNTAVDGKIYDIKRTCDYTSYYTNKDGENIKVGNAFTENCSSTSEFQSIASDYKHRKKDVEGKAIVTVRYAFADNGYYLADLKFTGHDDEFYTLHEGDNIKILVNNDDPTKISKN